MERERTYCVTVRDVTSKEDIVACTLPETPGDCPATKVRKCSDLVYEVLTTIIYVCYGAIFIASLSLADGRYAFFALWASGFSLLSSIAFADASCAKCKRALSLGTCPQILILLLIALLLAALLYYCTQGAVHDFVMTHGSDALTCVSIIIFFKTKASESRCRVRETAGNASNTNQK